MVAGGSSTSLPSERKEGEGEGVPSHTLGDGEVWGRINTNIAFRNPKQSDHRSNVILLFPLTQQVMVARGSGYAFTPPSPFRAPITWPATAALDVVYSKENTPLDLEISMVQE